MRAHIWKSGEQGRGLGRAWASSHMKEQQPWLMPRAALCTRSLTRKPLPTCSGVCRNSSGMSLGLIGMLVCAFMERSSSSVPQAVASVLVALARFAWFDLGVVSTLAAEMVKPERISSSKPQDISNMLWALASLGWYEPVVYDQLMAALQGSREAEPQNFSTSMYSCAIASHHSSSVNDLAQLVSEQDVSKQGGWDEQTLANTLYAWAVLSTQSLASDSLEGMAQHLLREVNARGPAALCSPIQLSQLHLAHLEAERVGLARGGLSTANGIQQAAAEEHAIGQLILQNKAKQSGGTAGEIAAVAALRAAGYEVELAGLTKGDCYVNLLVQHEGAPNGIAVDILAATDVLRHPLGQLNGKIRLQHERIRQRCDGLVLLSEGEVSRQPGLMVQRVQQELAKAAARREGGGEPSSSSTNSNGSYPLPPAQPQSATPGILQPKSKQNTFSKPSDYVAMPPQLKSKPQRNG